MEVSENKLFIAIKLKELRERNGYTQKDIGKITNKAHTTVASWESGKSQPDLATLFSLFMLYNVDDILLEFGYKKYQNELSGDEKIFLQTYRKLTSHSKKVSEEIVKNLSELEKNIISDSKKELERTNNKK